MKRIVIFIIILQTLLFIVYSCSVNRNNTRIKNIRQKSINYVDSIVNFNIQTNDYSNKLNVKAMYHWYNSNKISVNQGGYTGYLLCGKYQVFDKSKNLIVDGFFSNGLKHGEWKRWYSNGNYMIIQNWENGFKNGKEFIYNNIGQLLYQNSYKQGVLDGKNYIYVKDSIHVNLYRDGKLISKSNEKKWYKIIRDKTMRSGKKN